MTSKQFTRRSAILSGASLSLAGGLISTSSAALAAAPMLGMQTTRFNRFKLGSFEVTPLNEKMQFIDGGQPVASGVTAIAAFGHTPGHMAYMLESGGQQMVLIVDCANHYVWSLAYPDWEVRFDMDKTAAAATRRQMFGMLSADKLAFIGYHMPWPALGYTEVRDDGFRYVPASYQMMME